MAWLQVTKGWLKGHIIQLRDRLSVGRDDKLADIVISGEEIVSRKHAVFAPQGEGFTIEDVSRNGVVINGAKVAPKTTIPLRHNDQINICDDEFEAVFVDGAFDASSDDSTLEALISSKSDHSLQTQPAAKLAALLEITAKLSKTLQLDTQLPLVADSLLDLFPQADRCFLILSDRETGNLAPKIIRTRAKIDPSTARFSHTIVRQCLRTTDSILLSEGDPIPAGSDSVISNNMRSVMCVPLGVTDGPPFGVVQLDTQDPAKKFNKEDLHLLRGVALQAGIAMENARLHSLELAQVRVKNELDLAKHVQRNFLPKCVPELPGYQFQAYYEAAREVGGDYYDFINMPERRLAITLGDVAGKGMPAALLMAKLSSEVRYCLLTDRIPIDAMARLNDQLHPSTSPMDRFVTMIAAILDPATHQVTLISAGHPSPLLYRRADHTFTPAIPREDDGQSLGFTLGNKYQAYQVTLSPGDSLLLFSDGVTDAQSVAKKPFKMKGIFNTLQQPGPDSPHDLGQRLVEAVQKHAAGGPQYDDITLVCFGRPAS